MANSHIVVAYGRSPRHGFRAKAYVTDESGIKHTRTIGMGDTVEEAEADVVKYVRDIFRREGLPEVERIERRGRINLAMLDGNLF